MNGGTVAAELVGGIGLFLLGTRLAASGFGVSLGAMLRKRFAAWTEGALGSLMTGVAFSAVVPGSGALPASALGLAHSGGLGAHRAARLVVGCSFGAVFAALLVALDGAGWAAQALGLAALGIGALLGGLRSRRAAWGELAAGFGLTLLGTHLIGAGWEGLAGAGTLRSGLGISIALFVAGLALSVALRSPGAVVVLAVQGAAAGLLGGFTAAAVIIGATLPLPLGTVRAAREGGDQDRTVAALHVLHCALAALVGVGLCVWGADMPMLVERAPVGALFLFTLAIALVPAVAAWPFLGPVEQLLLSRLQSTRGATRAPLTPDAQTVPALAVEGLALAVDDAAATGCELARKVLNGAGVSPFRRDELLATVGRVEVEVDRFRRSLAHLRWPGVAVERVLLCERAARAWRQLCQELVALGGLEGSDPRGPLAVPFLKARQAVLKLVEGRGALDLDELAETREAVDARLDELRIAILYAFAADALDVEAMQRFSGRLERLRGLGRLAAEAREAQCRVALDDGALFATTVVEPAPEEPYEPEGEYGGEYGDELEAELDAVPSLLPAEQQAAA